MGPSNQQHFADLYVVNGSSCDQSVRCKFDDQRLFFGRCVNLQFQIQGVQENVDILTKFSGNMEHNNREHFHQDLRSFNFSPIPPVVVLFHVPTPLT